MVVLSHVFVLFLKAGMSTWILFFLRTCRRPSSLTYFVSSYFTRSHPWSRHICLRGHHLPATHKWGSWNAKWQKFCLENRWICCWRQRPGDINQASSTTWSTCCHKVASYRGEVRRYKKKCHSPLRIGNIRETSRYMIEIFSRKLSVFNF